MRVDVVNGAEGLANLKGDWGAVYDADPDAQYFLSWDWVTAWSTEVHKSSFVLAVRSAGEASPYCAFLPLRLRIAAIKGGGHFSIVEMACEGVADYTGLLCRPEMEDDAIKALSQYVKSMGWKFLLFSSFRASDKRMQTILANFPKKYFEVEDFNVIFPDGTDHGIFPYVELPTDWEDYLSTKLGSETRRKVRRFMRQVEGPDGFRITTTAADTLDRDLDTLFRFWTLMWGSDHETYVNAHHVMFRRCFEAGSLYLTVMWQGDRALGALANLLDDVKKAMLFKVMSRDETFGNPSPGFVLYAYAIRHAIERGYGVCDFLQGNHAFKYSFGAEELKVAQKKVGRRSEPSSGEILDRGHLPAALRSTLTMHQQGRLAEAERGYRQILHMDPQSRDAALGLNRLLSDRARNSGPDKKT
jgi:CelD/BcsL family acetyltransferase involved in cellulose biosynthesis